MEVETVGAVIGGGAVGIYGAWRGVSLIFDRDRAERKRNADALAIGEAVADAIRTQLDPMRDDIREVRHDVSEIRDRVGRLEGGQDRAQAETALMHRELRLHMQREEDDGK